MQELFHDYLGFLKDHKENELNQMITSEFQIIYLQNFIEFNKL